MHLLCTQWVQGLCGNIWKHNFVWISSFERWNHWRKKPRKSYPKKTHISPMGTQWVRPGLGNLWKVAFPMISPFELWNHWRIFSSKSYPQSVQPLQLELIKAKQKVLKNLKWSKINIYKDFGQRLLKSLKIFSVKKLSTDSPIRPALAR